jgi:transcription initiation factor IIE alpha subunit
MSAEGTLREKCCACKKTLWVKCEVCKKMVCLDCAQHTDEQYICTLYYCPSCYKKLEAQELKKEIKQLKKELNKIRKR